MLELYSLPYIAYLYANYTAYKNEDCARCNLEERELKCEARILCGENRFDFFKKDLSTLFDLSFEKCESNLTIRINLTIDMRPLNYSLNEIISYDDYYKYCENHEITSYITFIGHVVSITILVLVLSFYLFLDSLKILSSANITVSLSLALLLAQLFFLLSDFISKDIHACYSFGLLTHYFYLSYFAWSNIMSHKLWISTKPFQQLKLSKNKYFLFESLYAWLLPAVIISILFIDHAIKEKQYPLYGFMNNCWLSFRGDLLYFFIIPVISILILNLFFFGNEENFKKSF